MAGKAIQFGRRTYQPGDLIVLPTVYPAVRTVNGLLDETPRILLVLYDLETDQMTIEPVSYAVANHAWPEKLEHAWKAAIR